MKRIVKVTTGRGGTKYRVETNRILWVIPCSWRTVTLTNDYGEVTDAVFDTFVDAIKFVKPKKPKDIRREVWNSRDGLVRPHLVDDDDD